MKNAQKKNFGNTVKHVRKILWTENSAWTAGRTIIECEKNHRSVHFVRARLSADSFPWQCWHGRTRVYPPLIANMFPGWSTSMYTCFWIFLASFAPPCPSIILIQKGNCGRKPLTLCPFWRVSKKTQKFKLFFTPMQTPPRQKTGGNAVHLLRKKRRTQQHKNKMLQETWEMNYQFLSCSTMEEVVELLSGPIWPFEGLLSGPNFFFICVCH